MLHTVVDFLVNTIGQMGYFGIFALMFLESSFFPFPSEVVMIPAGYLVYQGEMSMSLVLLAGLLGSLSGAWFNYFLAIKYGRGILLRIVSYRKLEKLEEFFDKHGHISTFTCRLIPGVRQYISFPAGLAKMNKLKFTAYTAVGAFVWMVILTLLGFYLGENQVLIHQYLKEITIMTLSVVAIVTIFYIKNTRSNA